MTDALKNIGRKTVELSKWLKDVWTRIKRWMSRAIRVITWFTILSTLIISTTLLWIKFGPEIWDVTCGVFANVSQHTEDIMSVFITVVQSIVTLICCLGTVHFVLRLITMTLAPHDIFFSSPKLGRIKARVRNGRIVGFIAHLKGIQGEIPRLDPNDSDAYHTGPVHIDEETGKILNGEERIGGLWWKWYGVRFIGLDDIFKYKIEVATKQPDGTIKKDTVTADSLFFSGTYPMSIEEAETSDGIRGGLKFQITLQTTHAGESLKYKDWLDVVRNPILAIARDYVANESVEDLLKAKNELSSLKTGFIGCMKSLNSDSSGNKSLDFRVGQRVVAASITSVDFKDAVAKSMEAKKIAEGEAAAKRTSYEVDRDGIKMLGEARNLILKERREILSAKGGKLTAQVEQASITGEAIGKHKGTLVLGGTTIQSITADSEDEGS